MAKPVTARTSFGSARPHDPTPASSASRSSIDLVGSAGQREDELAVGVEDHRLHDLIHQAADRLGCLHRGSGLGRVLHGFDVEPSSCGGLDYAANARRNPALGAHRSEP